MSNFWGLMLGFLAVVTPMVLAWWLAGRDDLSRRPRRHNDKRRSPP